MSLQDSRLVMMAMKNVGAKSMILIGGEPTLHPELPTIIQEGKQNGFFVGIVTNGRKFSERSFADRMIGAGLDAVAISFEAPERDSFNEITQVSVSWDETLAALHLLSEYDVRLSTITTVSPMTISLIEDIARVVSACGVSQISFNFATPNYPQDSSLEDFSIDPKKAAEAIEKAFWVLKGEGIGISFLPTLPMCLFSEELRQELFPVAKMGCACHVYTGKGVVFGPSRNLLPCTHLTEFPTVNNLNLEDLSIPGRFKLFWEDQNGQPELLRKNAWKYPSRHCKSCDYWGKCIGGCPLFRKNYSPEKYIASAISIKKPRNT
jgi:radical SAM protein with 4Fe4S-binding SPASM domain